MRRTFFGYLFLVHGLAHAWAGVTASLDGPPWLVTLVWGAAMIGYFSTALGLLRVPILRDHWKGLLVAATVASVALLSITARRVGLVGLVVDLALMLVALTWVQPRADAQIAVVDAVGASGLAHPWWHRLGWTAGLVFLLYATAVVCIRPVYLRWGSTSSERMMVLPGDDRLPLGGFQVEHAITILAPADSVWPWLAQIGQDRGGFYSYDWIERLFGDRISNADRIHPEWQRIAPGDTVRATQSDYLGGGLGQPGWKVLDVVPGRAIVLEGWGAFVLRPVNSSTTRMIIRQPAPSPPGGLSVVLQPLNVFLLEPAHFIMQRAMLRGIRDRAEGRVHARHDAVGEQGAK